MVLQDNSFKTLVLILHQNAALFLSNNPRSELSDFFCTLNCGDKNLIIAITTISRFTSVFINFPKVLPNEREISNQLLTSSLVKLTFSSENEFYVRKESRLTKNYCIKIRQQFFNNLLRSPLIYSSV